MEAEEKHSCETMVIDSNKAVEFKLIRDKMDLQNDSLAFSPMMSHQIFGAQETIFGYKNLKVKLYFSAAKLNPYLEISYSDKVDPKKYDSVEADNIREILHQKLEIDLNENLDEFVRSLEKESQFIPPGELKESVVFDFEDSEDVDNKQKTYVIYYATVMNPELLAYHKRLQTFILWFIDAASFIDVDDEKWKFFLM